MKKTVITLLSIIIFVLAFLPACSSSKEPLRLTIIHTNDIRSHLDKAAQRVTVINQLRTEYAENHQLLLDAGNFFGGTPYFTLHQGKADLWFMNYLQYSAVNIGSHEFDKGPVVLANFINEAEFPVISANIDVTKESSLAKKISPWIIIKQGEERFGVFGLTTDEARETSSPGSGVVFNEYLSEAADALSDLQSAGITKIIALSNLGWDKNLELAKKYKGIDIIISTYSGKDVGEYPVVYSGAETSTLIVQAGENGDYIGCLNVTFDKDGIIRSWHDSRLIPVDDSVEEDKTAADQLATYKAPIADLVKTVIGETQVDLDGTSQNLRAGETNLGDLVADAMLDNGKIMGATMALWNSGSIRASIPAGNITLGQVIAVLPYDNYVIVVELSGGQLMAALENGVSQAEELKGRFPVVAGLRFTWDLAAPVFNRIKSVEVQTAEGYVPLDKNEKYKVATNDFIAKGGDGYTMFTNLATKNIIGTTDYQVLANYIKELSPLDIQVDGRIQKIQ